MSCPCMCTMKILEIYMVDLPPQRRKGERINLYTMQWKIIQTRKLYIYKSSRPYACKALARMIRKLSAAALRCIMDCMLRSDYQTPLYPCQD